MQDIRQSKDYANYLKTQGWIVEKIGEDFVFIKKIPFAGSLLKYQRPASINLTKLNKLVKKYRVFNLAVEPKDRRAALAMTKHGFKLIKPYLPAKTLFLNLEESEENIYEKFSKDARYAIRKNEEEKVIEEKILEKFQKNWEAAAARGRYVLSVDQLKNFKTAFSKNMVLLTNINGDSGAMFLVANNVGYYWYGYTSEKARKSLVQYKIVYEGIKWAKKRGAKNFDFEGIYDERFPDKKWLGFTKFKKKFGGEEKEYPGAYGKWRLPF